VRAWRGAQQPRPPRLQLPGWKIQVWRGFSNPLPRRSLHLQQKQTEGPYGGGGAQGGGGPGGGGGVAQSDRATAAATSGPGALLFADRYPAGCPLLAQARWQADLAAARAARLALRGELEARQPGAADWVEWLCAEGLAPGSSPWRVKLYPGDVCPWRLPAPRPRPFHPHRHPETKRHQRACRAWGHRCKLRWRYAEALQAVEDVEARRPLLWRPAAAAAVAAPVAAPFLAARPGPAAAVPGDGPRAARPPPASAAAAGLAALELDAALGGAAAAHYGGALLPAPAERWPGAGRVDPFAPF
jgi:hypothetical protein